VAKKALNPNKKREILEYNNESLLSYQTIPGPKQHAQHPREHRSDEKTEAPRELLKKINPNN